MDADCQADSALHAVCVCLVPLWCEYGAHSPKLTVRLISARQQCWGWGWWMCLAYRGRALMKGSLVFYQNGLSAPGVWPLFSVFVL